MTMTEQNELTEMAVGWLADTCRSRNGGLDDCGDPECEAARANARTLLRWIANKVAGEGQ